MTFRLAVPQEFSDGATVHLSPGGRDVRVSIAAGFASSEAREDLELVREVFALATDIETSPAPAKAAATPVEDK